MSSVSVERIDDFWRWFIANAYSMREIRSAEDPAYAELEHHLLKIHEGLGAEIGGSDNSDQLTLVITAYGDGSLFPLADAVVLRAPSISGWQIVGLKPPLLEDLEIHHEEGILKTQDLRFRVVENADTQGRIAIEIAVRSNKKGGNARSREDAAVLALSSFVGERMFACRIRIARIVAFSDSSAGSEYLPLGELAAILGIH